MIKCPAKKECNPFKSMKGGDEFEEVCIEACNSRGMGRGCKDKDMEERNNTGNRQKRKGSQRGYRVHTNKAGDAHGY